MHHTPTFRTIQASERRLKIRNFEILAGGAGGGAGGGLLELLVTRASRHLSLATSLYWFLRVECGSNTDKQQQQVRALHLHSICGS